MLPVEIVVWAPAGVVLNPAMNRARLAVTAIRIAFNALLLAIAHALTADIERGINLAKDLPSIKPPADHSGRKNVRLFSESILDAY
jgi:hypothetical protein